MSDSDEGLRDKYVALQQLFEEMGSTVVAFSGGIDSTLVLKVAFDTLGARAKAVTATSPTFPAIELVAVHQLSAEIGTTLQIVETDQLEIDAFVQNDTTRCFHCKTDLYGLLGKMKEDAQLNAIVDGTNMDDLQDDRPGIIAARALGVRSPLVEVGLGKSDIRALAKSLGLSNWDKPAAACLSSRVPRGIQITRAGLSRIERAEALLFQEGFRQVRVRDHDGIARIETESLEFHLLHDDERRHRIVKGIREIGFQFATLDLAGYQSGSTNEMKKAT